MTARVLAPAVRAPVLRGSAREWGQAASGQESARGLVPDTGQAVSVRAPALVTDRAVSVRAPALVTDRAVSVQAQAPAQVSTPVRAWPDSAQAPAASGQALDLGPAVSALVDGAGLSGAGAGGGVGGGAGAGGVGPGAGAGATGGRGMMPMHGGNGGEEEERERSTWLTEDDDVWGGDDGLPPVLN